MTGPDRSRTDHAGAAFVAGVDVGGTKVAVILVAADGTTLSRAVRPMTSRTAPDGIEPIVGAIRAALEAAGATIEDLTAIGVGVPGRVEPDGTVRHATNLGWHDVPLAARLTAEFGVPCAVGNDVRSAAAGLLDHEIAGGIRNLAYVAVGTGIGAGLVLEGRLHLGTRGMAGEIGHVIVEPDGATCSCGQRGCLETVASGPAVARRAAAAIEAGRSTVLRGVEPLTAKAVYEAARTGDPLACAIVEEAGHALARAIAGLVLTCDLELVLLGGGVAGAGSVFLDPILAHLGELRAGSPVVAEMIPAGTVRSLPPIFDAVAWGGVALARALARTSSGSPAGPVGPIAL
jgi:glucokinase